MGDDLVLHLHRLDDAEHLARLDPSPSATRTCEHGPLHRARHRVRRAAARARRRALAPAAGELAIRRLGHEHLHLDPPPVDLRERRALDRSAGERRDGRAPARRRAPAPAPRAAPTRRSRGTSRPHGSTDARAAPCGTRSASSPRRSRTRRARAASGRSRPRGRRRGRSASRSSGRRAARSPSPSVTPESTRTPGPAGSRYTVIVPGEGRKPFATSSALIRHSIAWPWRRTSSCVNSSGSPGRDLHLLAHDVDARDDLRDRVLHLDARVHLHEVVGAVGREQALDRPRGAVAGRAGRVDRDLADPRAQLGADSRATASPRRASDGGAGSCSRARRGGSTFPCASASTCTSTCRGSSR